MMTLSPPRTPYARLATIAGIVAVVIGVVYVVQAGPSLGSTGDNSDASAPASPALTPIDKLSQSGLKQTVINDKQGAWLATFTHGSRSVLMRGPVRTFAEPTSTDVTFKTDHWVRAYPKPYDGNVDQAWLKKATEQNDKNSAPDIIELAMQYIASAKQVKDDKGQIVGGDASYGPLLANGDRQEGADFNDYIGISYTYDKTVYNANTKLIGSLDNTGFVRMVWGYRGNLPLQMEPTKGAIPRKAHDMLESGLGVMVEKNANRQLTDFSRLQAGDVIFHDTSQSDGTRVDYASIYLGTDSQGNHRFISSRPAADGPTFGDIGGRSILDGNGLYARSLRAAKRF